MDDDTVKLIIIGFAKLLGIGTDGIERNHNIAIDDIILIVIEGDDIGIVIMPQILIINLENLLVIYKHIAYLSYLAAMRCSYLANPGTGVALLDLWHFHAIYIVCYHTLLPPIFILFLVKIHLLLFRRISIP